jgi:hypothetical protein
MVRTARVALFLGVTALASTGGIGGIASAQTLPPPNGNANTQPTQPAQPAQAAGQGIAVLAVGPSHDDAFALARAVYGSRLRPTALDEVRARVLAGGAPPANASRELRELAELRAGVTGEDAAGRRLLSGLAQQVGAQALLVVRLERIAAIAPPPPPGPNDWPSFEAPKDAPGRDGDATGGNVAGGTAVVARLFLVDSGEFDAARYAPDAGLVGPAAWASTVTSLEARFPGVSRTAAPSAAMQPTPSFKPEEEKSTPFYSSGWFWGSVGAAALLGAAFYFASRDTGSDPIHLQLHVPK